MQRLQISKYLKNIVIICKKTAEDPHHPKLKMLLQYLNNNHKIGVDIGAGTGHVGDYIAKNLNNVSQMYGIDMDEQFTKKIESLKNNKLHAITANACGDDLFKQLPNKVDFLIFNSVIHELISYGCNYNVMQFFNDIWPKWLSIVNKNGLVFVRDFIGINDNHHINKQLPFIIKIRTNNNNNFKIFIKSIFIIITNIILIFY